MFTRRRTDDDITSSSSSSSYVGRPIHNSIRPPTLIKRQDHIHSYIHNEQLAPSTRKVSDDDTTFDTVFQSVTGDTLILRVHYPICTSGMIVRPPSMTLVGVDAKHEWIDTKMRIIGYPPIQSSEVWIQSNILLGTAVHTVVQYLQLHPPTIIRFMDDGLRAIQPNKKHNTPTTMNGNHTSSSSSQPPPPPPAYHESMIQQSTSSNSMANTRIVSNGNVHGSNSIGKRPNIVIPHIDWPTIPTQFVELDVLNRQQLEDILQNDIEFQLFVNQLPVIQQYNTIQMKQQLQHNVIVSQSNIEHETKITELYQNVTTLQKELQQKIQEFQIYEQQQNVICQPPSISIVKKELQKSMKALNQQSEQIASNWLQSKKKYMKSDTTGMTNHDTNNSNNTTNEIMETFISDFMSIRKIQHIRAAKLEILQRSQQHQQQQMK